MTKTALSEQSERFKQAARDLGTDDDPERFKAIVKKVGSAPPVPTSRSKKEKGQPKDSN